ncbi:MAG: SET domain-containing protein-lysine N-methyltransferase [Lacibacter sp.]
MRLPSLYIAASPQRGRGIFTNMPIPAETVVEVAPVIVMSAAERRLLDQTLLHDYIFEWGEDLTGCAMALGWIALYNHAPQSNCEYFMDFEEEIMFVKTVRAIAAGEELFVNYNGNHNDATPVWFEQ